MSISVDGDLQDLRIKMRCLGDDDTDKNAAGENQGINGVVVTWVVAIDPPGVRFPLNAFALTRNFA